MKKRKYVFYVVCLYIEGSFIFLEGGYSLKNKLNKDFFVWLDQFYNVFPMTYDYTFKDIFKNHPWLLREFVGDILDLRFINECDIYFEDDYLKEKADEYGKFVRIYIVIDDHIDLVVRVNRELFEKDYFQNNLHENDWFNNLKRKGEKLNNDKKEKLRKTVEEDDFDNDYIRVMYEMEDVGSDIIRGVHQISIFVYTSHYRKLYFEDGYRNKKTIWLAALDPKSYTELYELMNQILDSRLLYMFMSYVIEMSSNNDIEYMLQKESYRKMRIREKYEIKKNNAIKEKQLEIADKMLEENIDLNTISKIASLTIDEIKKRTEE